MTGSYAEEGSYGYMIWFINLNDGRPRTEINTTVSLVLEIFTARFWTKCSQPCTTRTDWWESKVVHRFLYTS